MRNKKFDEKTSREIVIHFLNRLKMECDEHFPTTGLERLPRIFNLLSNDSTGTEIWKTAYQMTFGKPFKLISEEEIFTTLIGFCAQQTHSCKLNLMGLMDLLFLIRYPSEANEKEHEKDRAIWKEVVNFFSTKDPLYAKNNERMKVLNKYSWNLIDIKGLGIWKFGSLISNFMSEIALEYRDLFLDSTVDALLAYLADLCTNGTYYELEKETYEKMSGTPGGEEVHLTQEETFTLVIEFCALHICHWGFKMKEVLALLLAMRYDPENNKKNKTIWNELMHAALQEIG